MARDTARALLLAPFHPPALERLNRLVPVTYESWMDTRRLLSPEELIARIEQDNLHIVIIEADFIFDEVFQNTKKLRLVGVCRNAVDNVDVAAATEHGVLVVNTPARNAVSVAELTVGLMLSLARHLPAAHSLVKEGRWLDPVAPYISLRGIELAGKIAGIVGLGAIGSEVARRLRAFDMEILVYDPYVNPAKVTRLGARPVDLPELMKKSDFVAIHCPLSPRTAGLIGAAEIDLMKPSAYLINTASWEVVEEKALYHALEQRLIAGAAFDTYQTHPVSPQSPFLKLDNVVFTPHIGGATDGTVERYSNMMVADVKRFLEGKRPQNLVNPEAWQGNAR
jgi:phosphoglycerate dehydrogenase-like enzyme